MSLPATSGVDAATSRLMAGELAKSLWATAKPQPASEADGDDGGQGAATSAADTYATLFTDVLADALAGTTATKGSTR